MNLKNILYVQNDEISVTIKGIISHPSFSGIDYTKKESQLVVECRDNCEIETCVENNLMGKCFYDGLYKKQFITCPVFFEQQRYEIIIEPQKEHRVEFWHENYNVRKNVTPVGREAKILSGIINFGNEIGMSDLIILLDGKEYLKLKVEVFPSKISYKEDYKAIVSDITAEVYNLVFDFLKKTYSTFDVSTKKQASLTEFFAIMRKIYRKFIVAADMVIAKPHHILEKEYQVLPSFKIKKIDNRSIRWLEKHPEKMLRNNGYLLAEEVLAVKKYVTYDTKENQLTKYMLQNTANRLEILKKEYLKLDRDKDEEIIVQIDQMISEIKRRCNTGFMKGIEAKAFKSGMSLVFSMAPGYKELFHNYLLLQHGLSITGSIFNVSVKDLAVLYEYWCFIKLNSIMKQKYKLISQDIIKVTGKGLFVSLIKGRSSKVKYYNPKTKEIITLSYNPNERSGPTVSQKPDNVLALKKQGSEVNYEYVFDAKYKINPALPGSAYQKIYSTPGPQDTDINTMHRYRDAIVSQNYDHIYERQMFGAYVLFPYQDEEEYKNHKFYRSIERINIGGLPFLPSATGLVSKLLDELIADSPDSAFERTTLPSGINERTVEVDWSKRDTLIGTLEDSLQIKYCKLKNVYYLPVNLLKEDDLPIHYIALYEKNDSENGIYNYAVVRKIEVVQKNTIPILKCEESNTEELYYKFILNNWEQLEHPIYSDELKFKCELTTKFQLTNSTTVQELLLKSKDEFRFYKELRRISESVCLDDLEKQCEFTIADNTFAFEGDHISFYKNKNKIEQYSILEFSKNPKKLIRQIEEQIEEKVE